MQYCSKGSFFDVRTGAGLFTISGRFPDQPNGRSSERLGRCFGASPAKPYTSMPARIPSCSKAKTPANASPSPKIKSPKIRSPPVGSSSPAILKFTLAQPHGQTEHTRALSNCSKNLEAPGVPFSNIQRVRSRSSVVSSRSILCCWHDLSSIFKILAYDMKLSAQTWKTRSVQSSLWCEAWAVSCSVMSRWTWSGLKRP